jgi:Ca2+-binding RTX toxin-like protein
VHLADSSSRQLRERAEASLNDKNKLEDGPVAPGRARTQGAAGAAGRRSFEVEGNPPPNAKGAVTPNSNVEGWTQRIDGSFEFNGTTNDDAYTVREDTNGDVVVRNDGTSTDYTLSAADATLGVTINTGDGKDNLTVDASVTLDLTINSGAGDDVVNASRARGAMTINGGADHDILTGGRGDDDIDGGDGEDRITGGDGHDSLRGGGDRDYLAGGDGRDQLLGGGGDDEIHGGDNEDFIMGNDGIDEIFGDRGSDAIYTDALDRSVDAGGDAELDLIVGEAGSPRAANMGGNDVQVSYDRPATEAWLAAHPEFQRVGNDETRERTLADIGVMLSVPEGRGLLSDLSAELVSRGETMFLDEKVETAGGQYFNRQNRATAGNWAATYPDGTNRHPLPALYHELAHGYQDLLSGFPAGMNDFNGVGANVRERQVVGLEWLDSSGVLHGANTLPYTDNLFRMALGLPTRSTYGGELGSPQFWYPEPK